MKYFTGLFVFISLALSQFAFAQNANEAAEPAVKGNAAIDLLKGNNLDAWKVPSTHWQFKDGAIVGETGAGKLSRPEWIYSKQRFSNFEFTCELRLTGDDHRNTGIYYRVNTFLFRNQYEAPSGYEFDAAATGSNYNGSVGDWYSRPSLRISADSAVVNKIYNSDNWNRMTLLARGNHLEYWINGIKVMDYTDPDPKGSREGIIGFQMHDGAVMKAEFRNIRVLPLEP